MQSQLLRKSIKEFVGSGWVNSPLVGADHVNVLYAQMKLIVKGCSSRKGRRSLTLRVFARACCTVMSNGLTIAID